MLVFTTAGGGESLWTLLSDHSDKNASYLFDKRSFFTPGASILRTGTWICMTKVIGMNSIILTNSTFVQNRIKGTAVIEPQLQFPCFESNIFSSWLGLKDFAHVPFKNSPQQY